MALIARTSVIAAKNDSGFNCISLFLLQFRRAVRITLSFRCGGDAVFSAAPQREKETFAERNAAVNRRP